MLDRRKILNALGVLLVMLVALVVFEYRSDVERARERVSLGSQIAQTKCGPIEYATGSRSTHTEFSASADRTCGR